MSLNCKHCGCNGKLPNNFIMKVAKETSSRFKCEWKWNWKLILVCILGVVIGFLLFNSGLIAGGLRPKLGTEEVNKVSLKRFNVSKDQLHALADLFLESDQVTMLTCTKMLGHETLMKNLACAVKVTCSHEWEYLNQHVSLVEDSELHKQCPIQDIDDIEEPKVHEENSLSLVSDAILSSISSDELTSGEVETHGAKYTLYPSKARAVGCERFPSCSVKGFWWAVIGVLFSCVVSFLRENLLENKGQESCHLLKPTTQQQQSSSRSSKKWRMNILIMSVIGGVILSLWLFWYLNKDIKFKRKETLSTMCDERARMLQDQFNVSMNHVHALALLIATFHHGKQPSAIDQKTFGEYTERTSFERPLTSGVSYALRVLHSEREQFEKDHGWPIRKMPLEDQTLAQNCEPEDLEPSSPSDEYAPVIFSQDTVAYIGSVDMMTGEADRENIYRARASGKGVLTTPLKLLNTNHTGVVLTFAVYNNHLPPDATEEQRINATLGYLGASYDMPSLVEKLLHQLAEKQTIVVNVYETTDEINPISMYGEDVVETGLLHVSSLDFGDPARKHEMHCRFKHSAPTPWSAILAAVAILVIIFLLAYIFHATIIQIDKVERDFLKMSELKHLAEAADVAKSQFLATVSHEIRTPMNGVLGMLKMLMDTNLDLTQMDYAQIAFASGKDLISLINEVLDQAKIESGRLELETVPFDLRAVLDKILSLHYGKSHEKGIELAVYVSDQVPLIVVGDPGRFRQIITNLVGNSIKFTRDRGHIFVSVHLVDEARAPLEVRDEVLRQSSHNSLSGFPVVDRWKSWESFKNFSSADLGNDSEMIKLLVTVEDTGVGIPLEAQRRIFMPFMQADSSTSRMYGGTGIGLSISKRLVDLMGGEIGFVSEPGMGSTFSFTASLGKGDFSSLDTRRPHFDPASSDFQGLKALVVDDKCVRAEVTRYHIRRLGMSADVAFSLGSACDVLSSYSGSSASLPCPMVLVDKDVWAMDTSLPFHCLIKELRENGRPRDPTSVPRLFLLATSTSQTEKSELKSAYSVDNVLTKPLRLSVLITGFYEVLGFGRNRLQQRVKRTEPRSLLTRKKILVVDDNRVNRMVAEGALKKYGAIVTCVNSGKHAVEMLKPPHNFDACFMDLQMPEMDGFQATREIRDLESQYNERIDSGDIEVDTFANVIHWHTPILAMTADVIQASNEECLKCGMDDYVAKPFDEEQLYRAVSRFFEAVVKE